jgi:hypothetical protein
MKLLTNNYTMHFVVNLGATSPLVHCTAQISLDTEKSKLSGLAKQPSSILAHKMLTESGQNGTHPKSLTPIVDWLDTLIGPGGELLLINCLSLLPVLSFILMSGVGKNK